MKTSSGPKNLISLILSPMNLSLNRIDAIAPDLLSRKVPINLLISSGRRRMMLGCWTFDVSVSLDWIFNDDIWKY